jgi:hypothetical protein
VDFRPEGAWEHGGYTGDWARAPIEELPDSYPCEQCEYRTSSHRLRWHLRRLQKRLAVARRRGRVLRRAHPDPVEQGGRLLYEWVKGGDIFREHLGINEYPEGVIEKAQEIARSDGYDLTSYYPGGGEHLGFKLTPDGKKRGK